METNKKIIMTENAFCNGLGHYTKKSCQEIIQLTIERRKCFVLINEIIKRFFEAGSYQLLFAMNYQKLHLNCALR